MQKSSPAFGKLKALTISSSFLLLLFFLFFDQSKHQPALAATNPFLDDPFDAVGSFGIQLSALAVALSLLRLLRPYPDQRLSVLAVGRILHSNVVALLSILVTLADDTVAGLRFPRAWLQSTSGWLLVGLVAVLFALAGFTCWLNCEFGHAQGQSSRLFSASRIWSKAVSVSLAGLIVLAIYPVTWRQSVPGEIFTILVGMGFLFALVSTLAQAILPATTGEPTPQGASQDALGDVAAIYQGLRRQVTPAGFLFEWFEKIVTKAWLRTLLDWINPRKHALNLALFIAIGMGVFLILAEAVGEGMPDRRIIGLLVAIYISMEGVGILTGFVLLNGYLGIFSLEGN